MIHWGINALNHGSSLAVFQCDELIKFFTCSNDLLDASIVHQSLTYGGPSNIFWYERPYLKKLRQLRAGQWQHAFDTSVIPRKYLNQINLKYAKLQYTPHHASHAAAGYYTSPFDHCAVVVLDAIGEFECATIWQGRGGKLKKIWSRSYPSSLGLFYSAFTQKLGLTPILQESVLQQLAQQGNPDKFYPRVAKYFSGTLKLNYNFHQGVRDQNFCIESTQDQQDLAAAVQQVFVQQVDAVMLLAQRLTGSDSLVYMGGCALNSAANHQVVEPKFKYIWSLPQPGDPSSSIGAVLYHTQQRLPSVNLGVAKHIKISV